MTAGKKNILVAVTTLGALVALGWMIIQFGGSLGGIFSGEQYRIVIVAPRVDGLSEGANVTYQGMPVGRVGAIRLAEERDHFVVETLVRSNTNLPQNVIAKLVTQNFVSGAAAVELTLPEGALPEGQLEQIARTNEPVVIEARYAGTELLPDNFSELVDEMTASIRQFRESNIIANANEQLRRVGDLAASLDELAGDDMVQTDVREALASVRRTATNAEQVVNELQTLSGKFNRLSDQASGVLTQTEGAITDVRGEVKTVSTQVTQLTTQLDARLGQIAELINTTQQIAQKINQGQGTAGQLVNDQRLYESLVDTSRLLELTVADLNRLVEQWEEEGVSFRLGS